MVIGGLKAGTDYGFVGDTWNPDDFGQLKKLLEAEGLRVTEPTVRQGTNLPFRQGHIYNPTTLKEQTANSTYDPPYDGVMPLEQWINQAEDQGYSTGAIWGKIYSFPESAIADFTAQEMGISIQGEEKQTACLGNETYWFIAPAKPDVIKREHDKKQFFDNLNSTPEIKRMFSSPELKRSDEEWRRRLPAQLKKH